MSWYSSDSKWIARMVRLANERPDEVEIVYKDEDGLILDVVQLAERRIWDAEAVSSSLTIQTKPLQDAASVHVVALLSSIVLGITENCPLRYSAIAKRLRQWSLTPSLVCSNHTRAAKAHNGRSCKSSYKVAVKQLCGSGETMELLPHFL